MKEYTIIDTIQVTRIVKTEKNLETALVTENGKNIVEKLYGFA